MSSRFLFHVDPPSVADSGDEIGIQTRLRSRMKILAPTVRLVAIPNAGKRTAWAAMQAKREGLAKGFVDLQALWEPQAQNERGIAFLEIKDRKGSLTPEQITWLNWLHQAGFPCGCFRSADTAVAFLRDAGAPFMAEAA